VLGVDGCGVLDRSWVVSRLQPARSDQTRPLMIVGQGTNEIQRNVIASQLVARGGV
jgi:hypothetical protein